MAAFPDLLQRWRRNSRFLILAIPAIGNDLLHHRKRVGSGPRLVCIAFGLCADHEPPDQGFNLAGVSKLRHFIAAKLSRRFALEGRKLLIQIQGAQSTGQAKRSFKNFAQRSIAHDGKPFGILT